MNKLKFWHQYINCNNFKSKQVTPLRKTIEASRLSVNLKFRSYGNISFESDDVKHKYPIVNELEDFHRTKTNCIIYDIVDNNGMFDKLFLYQTFNSKGNLSFFGYVMLNEKTNKMWHKYFIEAEDDALCRDLNKSFWLLTDKAKKLYGEYI